MIAIKKLIHRFYFAFFILTINSTAVFCSFGSFAGYINNSDSADAVYKDDTFGTKHKLYLERTKKPIGLLFIGDSMTEGWTNRAINGLSTWNKEYLNYDAANFGVSGDKTQNVIWRISNGELNNINPKAVVLMIGTNNSHDYVSQEIANGITRIVTIIQTKLPNTKIILLGIMPRYKVSDENVINERIIKVNEQISKLHDGKKLVFLNIRNDFNFKRRTFINDYLCDDRLHFSEIGYKNLANFLRPEIDKAMIGYSENSKNK